MFKRILIANRGEIACRIARTCGRIGVEFVAVYSDADAGTQHLRGAAATVRIGEAPAASSYLDGARIIRAALDTGCEAVHPGYGFLSENAQFAQAVVDAGLVFIGPKPQTIDALGDKARAKRLMREAGVPTVPGGTDASEDLAQLADWAQVVGYPVLLKPSAGGGGKGMAVVRERGKLAAAVESAVRLARSSFGDGRLLVERYVDQPRHVEVQVFGDTHGNVVHAHERECSLQRRHQKVIEEAPAAGLPPATREAMLQAAVLGARAVGYVNAGTFEFIVGSSGEFFFLEVNTRLQVEHPVSEAITGLDFVEWQLRIASGEPLPCTQAQIRREGHAFEARVYAEDPLHNFRPTPGRAERIRWPEGVRVETALADRDEVKPYYDPMVAKLVVHGADRVAALARMRAALDGSAVLGLTTNLGLLSELTVDRDVVAGNVHTRFIDEHLERLLAPARAQPFEACTAAVGWLQSRDQAAAGPWGGTGISLDRAALSPEAPLGRLVVGDADGMRDVAVLASPGDGELKLRIGDAAEPVDVCIASSRGGVVGGRLAGQHWWALQSGESVELQLGGWRRSMRLGAHSAGAAQGAAGGEAVAPMHGRIVAVKVHAGCEVAAGDTLVVIEAMKMENAVAAPRAGVVEQVLCALGESVAAGQPVVLLRPQG